MSTLAVTVQTLGGLLPLTAGIGAMAMRPKWRSLDGMMTTTTVAFFGLMAGGIVGHWVFGEPAIKPPVAVHYAPTANSL